MDLPEYGNNIPLLITDTFSLTVGNYENSGPFYML